MMQEDKHKHTIPRIKCYTGIVNVR